MSSVSYTHLDVYKRQGVARILRDTGKVQNVSLMRHALHGLNGSGVHRHGVHDG